VSEGSLQVQPRCCMGLFVHLSPEPYSYWVMCLPTTRSLDGVRCYACPTGSKCTIAVRRATETVANDYGSASPRTKEGYYLFEAPASKHARQCNPSNWKDGDPCKQVTKIAGENVTDIINDCANANGFKDYWTADRTFSCLSGLSFYACEVSGVVSFLDPLVS
jgi:hypothetical protein